METTLLIAAPPLTELAQSWAVALAAEGKSAATVRSYAQGISGFLRWYQETTDADPLLDAASVRAYLADLRKAGQSTGTVRLRYAALRLLGRWLVSEGIIESDPLPVSRSRLTVRTAAASSSPASRSISATVHGSSSAASSSSEPMWRPMTATKSSAS